MSASILQDRSAQMVMAIEGLGYDEARNRLERAALVIDADADPDPAHQAALLANVRCAVRMFKGGVFLGPSLSGRLTVGGERPQPLRRALEDLGARSIVPPEHAVRLHLGPGPGDADLHVWCDGWTAALAPRGPEACPLTGNVLTGVAAGGLAAAELFRKAALGDVLAAKRGRRLDLWGAPSPPSDARLRSLPKAIWLLGLGNLGQATLFTLGLLPWADPAEITLLLNDADMAGPENLPVQVLTTHAWVGAMKARKAADWAETRGFRTVVEERRFLAGTAPAGNEPRLALVGVDNLETRRLAAEAGFDLVIDAGLGATGPEAFDIRIHAFPGSQTAAAVWPEGHGAEPRPLPDSLAALVAQGRLDPCGAITIAGGSIGVPCTAMVAAALQVAQACRALEIGLCADRVDLSLADLGRAAWREMAEPPPQLPLAVQAAEA